jgi:hypothetical protein
MATLTSYEGSNNDLENQGTTGPRAQGFQVPSNSTCTGCSIYGSRGNGATGTFSASVYSGAAPDSTLVYTETFNTSVLHVFDNTPYWNDITFASSFSLVAGTQYYLRIIPLTGSAIDEVRWSLDNTSPAYTDGARWLSSGGVWAQDTSIDENFRIYGTVSATASPRLRSLLGVGL